MSETWLALLMLAVTCALVQANGYYYIVGDPTALAYGRPASPLIYSLLPSPQAVADCDKDKKKETSDSSSSEDSSSESNEGEAEKEDSSNSENSGEKEEKEEGKSESSESSDSSSSEETEETKPISGSALFPPKPYVYAASPGQQLAYQSYPYGYYPSYAYSMFQPASYPTSTAYQYYTAPAASVMSSKVVSSPVVYSAPATNGYSALSKGYNIRPGAQVVAAPLYWNSNRFTYYKK